MSRSRKKNFVCKDSPSKDKKRFANKRVRRSLSRDHEARLPHAAYKKLYESYDICDYMFRYNSFEDFVKSNHLEHEDKKKLWRFWMKHYAGK